MQLELEDVKHEKEIDVKTSPGVSAVLETFDGLRLHVHTTKVDEQVWGKFSAEFDANLIQGSEPDPKSGASQKPDEKEATKDETAGDLKTPEKESLLKKPDEVQQEVEALNQRVKNWAYALALLPESKTSLS